MIIIFKVYLPFKAFLENSGLVQYVAGHDGAAGFGITSKLVDDLFNYANTNLNADDFENCYTVDYILDGRKNQVDLLSALASHPEYFGNHIDEIKVVITNITLANIMVMGANKDSIKISFNGIDYVRFKDLDFIEQINNNRTKNLKVLGRINLNEFAGRTTCQIFIDDYEFTIDNSKYDF